MFEEEQITLNIPKEGLVLESGWTITPHTHPGVSLYEWTAIIHSKNFNCLQKFPTDHQTAGRQVCTWSSGALLSAECEVDWTAGEVSRVGA